MFQLNKWPSDIKKLLLQFYVLKRLTFKWIRTCIHFGGWDHSHPCDSNVQIPKPNPPVPADPKVQVRFGLRLTIYSHLSHYHPTCGYELYWYLFKIKLLIIYSFQFCIEITYKVIDRLYWKEKQQKKSSNLKLDKKIEFFFSGNLAHLHQSLISLTW